MHLGSVEGLVAWAVALIRWRESLRMCRWITKFLTISFVTPFLKSAIVLSRSNWSIPGHENTPVSHITRSDRGPSRRSTYVAGKIEPSKRDDSNKKQQQQLQLRQQQWRQLRQQWRQLRQQERQQQQRQQQRRRQQKRLQQRRQQRQLRQQQRRQQRKRQQRKRQQQHPTGHSGH